MNTQFFLSSRAERSHIELSFRAQSAAADEVEGPAVYRLYRQSPLLGVIAVSPRHMGTASLLSALNERHPRTTRFLALLFFLAGVALFVRMM